ILSVSRSQSGVLGESGGKDRADVHDSRRALPGAAYIAHQRDSRSLPDLEGSAQRETGNAPTGRQISSSNGIPICPHLIAARRWRWLQIFIKGGCTRNISSTASLMDTAGVASITIRRSM